MNCKIDKKLEMEKYAKNICKLKKVLNIDSEDDEAQIYGIEIFPNLYLSGESLARNLKKLKELGITHIVNCASPIMKDGKEILESIWSSVSIEPTYYSEIGFTEANYLALPVLDTEDFDISVYFESATRFIDSALNSTETSSSSEVAASTDRKQRPLCVQASSKLANTSKVVIHCAMGISRSATIVIAYLLMRARDPFPSVEEAMRFVRTRRSICPNDGFLVHLFQLESRLQSNCQQVKSSSCIEVTSERNPQPTHVAVDR